MRKQEFVDYKSMYDELQQKEYDELYRLLTECGGCNVLVNDQGDAILEDEDIPVISMELEGTYFYQDVQVNAVCIGTNDKIILVVEPKDGYETYTVENIKEHVAYHHLSYVIEYLVNSFNKELFTN